MAKDLFAVPEDAFDAFFDNFTLKLLDHIATLNIDPAVATEWRQNYLWYHWALQSVTLFKGEYSERVQWKNILADGPAGSPALELPTVPVLAPPAGAIPEPAMIPHLRLFIQSIKVNPAYTEAIGEDLGIIAPETPGDENPKPSLKGEALLSSNVLLTVSKKGHDAVILESQRGDETAWTELVKITGTKYTDKRAPLVAGKPEERRYRATYCDNDEAVGVHSDVVTVVTQP